MAISKFRLNLFGEMVVFQISLYVLLLLKSKTSCVIIFVIIFKKYKLYFLSQRGISYLNSSGVFSKNSQIFSNLSLKKFLKNQS